MLALAWTGAALAQTPAAPQPSAAPAGATAAAPASPLQKPGPAPVSPKFNDVMTAVIYADAGTVTQLLDLGRWVDKPDSNGLTPLMVAVHLRDEGMVRLLLERGADPNAQAPGGEAALGMAQANGEGGIEGLLRRAGAR
jgi:ankyrin repeat protein